MTLVDGVGVRRASARSVGDGGPRRQVRWRRGNICRFWKTKGNAVTWAGWIQRGRPGEEREDVVSWVVIEYSLTADCNLKKTDKERSNSSSTQIGGFSFQLFQR